jgi:hypothetical protein
MPLMVTDSPLVMVGVAELVEVIPPASVEVSTISSSAAISVGAIK